MLRVTFIILAIVASAVTLLIGVNEWWEYTPMAGLILITIILLIYVPMSERTERKDEQNSSNRPPELPFAERGWNN